MTQPCSPESAIFALLKRRGAALAFAIGMACSLTPDDVRARLVMLESMRLIVGRHDNSTPPRRVYPLTDEGLRKVEP